MFTPTTSRQRPALLAPILIVFSLLLVFSGVFLDANAGDLAPNPTQEPTNDPIDDIVANPTEEPTREPIDDIVSNPTEEPTREPIDDVVANPTETPAIDDEAIPTTGTVRVIKLDCPLGIVEDATLSDYLKLCPEAHNGVEFVVNDVNSAQAGVTVGGVVEWTGVDPGVFNITETVPAGYSDPIVFCGYTESPGGGVQHPTLMDSTGGVVAGTFPDAMFEYVCYWMNIKATGQVIPGADDITSRPDDGTASFLLFKRLCPSGTPPYQDAAWYLEHCAETLDGIPFTVSHGNGSSTKSTTDGEAEWHGIPLGPFTVDEDLPVQFGEPIVFCGWTAFHEGIVYDAFAQPATATGGTVELEVFIPGATHFCYYMNVPVAGDLADPSSVANTLVTRKWDCPDGTRSNQPERDYYYQRCSLMLEPVEFTLSTANGDETKSTSGGFAEWAGVSLGEFTLTESIPSGYGRPTVFCGWYANWDGYHYDAFPQLVILAAAGVIKGEITIPNTDYFCDIFNIAGGIDDLQANPTEVPAIDDFQGNATAGIVRVEKRDCPLGVPVDAILSEYLRICTQLHDGVAFELETLEGVSTDTTAMGQVTWTGVPGGTFEIRETIPAGYGDPIVFCGYTESQGGGVQHPSLQPSAGGAIAGTLPEGTIFEYVCYWMNIPNTGQVIPGADDLANAGGGGLSTLVIEIMTCPFGMANDLGSLSYVEQCTESLDGVTFTVTHANGSSSKQTAGGQASWQGLPFPPYTIEETLPPGYGDALALCSTLGVAETDGEGFHRISFDVVENGVHELHLDTLLEENDPLYTNATCTFFNIPMGPGSFTQGQETSNDLTVRQWLCDNDTLPSINKVDMNNQCSLSSQPVEFNLTTSDGASTQATDPGWTTWETVPLGEFSLQQAIPGGYGEPIVFCDWVAYHEGNIYSGLPHIVPSAGGLVEGEITVPNTSYACDFYNISTSAGIGGPDSVTANPPDESNTLVVHKWFCEVGMPANAHLRDYFEQCQLATDPVEFTLDNADGESTQATTGGTATWEDVPLGPFTLQEHIPAGYEILVVWCGFSAFWDGAVYDGFAQPAPVQDGMVEREIVIPNTHYRCDFINAPATIDDLQANPTEVPAIDDITSNPPAEESPWFRANAKVCPAGFDINVTWIEVFQACTTPIEGVEFTFTDASGSSTQALTGNFVQWDDAGIGEGQTVELSETYPDGYTEPYVLCSSWPEEAGDPFDWYYEPIEVVDGTITVTPNLDEGDGPLGVIPSGEGYACTFLHFEVDGATGPDDITSRSAIFPAWRFDLAA